MDPASLSALLAPALSFLADAGREAAGEAARKLGSEVWDHVQRLWARLRPGIEASPAAREVVEDAAAHPDDPEAVAALTRQLRKLLEADPALRRDVEEIWSQGPAASVVAAGERSVAIGGSASHSVIVTGDDARVNGG